MALHQVDADDASEKLGQQCGGAAPPSRSGQAEGHIAEHDSCADADRRNSDAAGVLIRFALKRGDSGENGRQQDSDRLDRLDGSSGGYRRRTPPTLLWWRDASLSACARF